MVSIKKFNKRKAKQLIKEHFNINDDGVTFCPYLIWDENTEAQAYFSKDLWAEICRQFLGIK
jgi:hypothetical protein